MATVTIDARQLEKLLAKYPLLVKPFINEVIAKMGADAETLTKPNVPVNRYYTTLGAKDTKIVGRLKGGIGYAVTGNFRIRPHGRLRPSFNRGGADNVYTHNTGKMELEYGSRVKYAPSIVGDTQPYLIQPKKKKFLYFAVSANLALMVKRVTHPGGIKTTGAGQSIGLLSRIAKVIMGNSQKYVDGVSQGKELFK